MALQRPALSDLITRTVADIQSRLPGADPLLRESVLGSLARAHAGALHGIYGLADYLSGQITPATATDNLDRLAQVWGVSRLLATAAEGGIDVTGRPGTAVPSGLQYQSQGGVEYRTTASATLDAQGEATVAARAADTGPAGNLNTAAELTLITPTAGIDSVGYVAVGAFAGGSDREADDRLRQRLLARIQAPPHGGNAADYRGWALAVAGVSRVWVAPLYSGDGTVRVWIGETNFTGAALASSALVAQVQDYIDARKPVTAAVTVAAPTVVAQDFEITLVPSAVEVREAVRTELDQVFKRDADPEGAVLISRLREAVSIALGESDHTMTSPVANLQAGPGEILARGAVTFS